MNPFFIEPEQCVKDGCTKSYIPYEWEKKEATRLGWFFQRNGDSWCPDHIPDWVAEWRAKRARENP